jgi:hypothetical protein
MDKLPFDAYDFFGYLASGLVLIVGMQFVLGFPSVVGRDLQPVEYALLILAVYVFGQIIATPSKALLEDIIVTRGLGAPNVNLMRDQAHWAGWIVFPNFCKPLPPPVRNRIESKIGDPAISGESLFLAIRFNPATLANEPLIKRLESFRDRYGFNRNLSFSCLVVGLALLIKGNIAMDAASLRYGWATMALAVLLFYRYLKFYRQYTYELFNTFAG